MASFAQETPVSPAQPYFWSRPTSEPKPDISGEIRGKAIGQALESTGETLKGGVHAVTAAYEKGIQNAIYAGVDPLRDEYMSRLHEADEALQGHGTPDPLGRDSPRDVKQLPHTINTLDSARANGKLSQTDYDARLTALAKDIRAKYPGFRQYVDEEFRRVTGRDSANQYIRSVIQDIDSFIAGRQAKRDSLESKLMSTGLKYEGADAVINAYKKDPDGQRAYALHWLNANEAADHARSEHRADMALAKDQIELDSKAETAAFDKFSSVAGKNKWAAMNHALFMAADLHNPEMNKAIRDMENDPGAHPELTATQATMIGNWVTLQEQSAKQAMFKFYREATTSDTTGGPEQSRMNVDRPSAVTDKKIWDTVEEQSKAYWDPIKKALVKGDVPLAMRTKELNVARAQDDLDTLMTNKQYGATIQRLHTIREEDPNLYQMVTQALQGNDYYNKHLAPLIAKNVTDLFTPPEQGGKPLSTIIDENRAKNIYDGKFWRSNIGVLDALGKTGKGAVTDQAAEALMRNVYGDPDPGKILQAFADDSTHWFTPNRAVAGRQYVYDKMFSEGAIKHVSKLAKDKPELYDMMEGAVEAQTKVLMPGNYLKADIEGPEEFQTSEEYTPRRVVHYNDETHKFTINSSTKHKVPAVEKAEFDQVASNLSRLASVAQNDPNAPQDANMRILAHLVNAYPSAEPRSMVHQMIQAIVATKQAKETEGP